MLPFISQRTILKYKSTFVIGHVSLPNPYYTFNPEFICIGDVPRGCVAFFMEAGLAVLVNLN